MVQSSWYQLGCEGVLYNVNWLYTVFETERFSGMNSHIIPTLIQVVDVFRSLDFKSRALSNQKKSVISCSLGQ